MRSTENVKENFPFQNKKGYTQPTPPPYPFLPSVSMDIIPGICTFCGENSKRITEMQLPKQLGQRYNRPPLDWVMCEEKKPLIAKSMASFLLPEVKNNPFWHNTTVFSH